MGGGDRNDAIQHWQAVIHLLIGFESWGFQVQFAMHSL
jgi:hypothetical protein